METKGMNILEKKLREYQGGDALISISHKLYGSQQLKVKLDYIWNNEKVGFRASKQEIYIDREKIINYGTKDGIYFADDLMEIKIKRL